jgi:hypothetical protein
MTLYAGTYQYTSVSGMIFSFALAEDLLIAGAATHLLAAISEAKGSFPVSDNSSITIARADGADIDPAFTFSCADNVAQLGYEDEDNFTFRQRILNDTTRQDHIKELELKIGNLPNIFECNLVLNQGVAAETYDGITINPLELLISITGVPTDEVARLVATDVLYATHIVDPDDVVYYYNDRYVGGKYPVYFKYHDKTDFQLSVTYQYDETKIQEAQVESAITALLYPYSHAVRHVDIITEDTINTALKNLNLPSVIILNVDVLNSSGTEIQYLRIPKTRIPNMTAITFDAVEVGSL